MADQHQNKLVLGILKNILPHPDVKIAIVDDNPRHAGRNAYIEAESKTVALNLAAFPTIEEAERWLASEDIRRKPAA
jgi:hypothetical protein